MSLSRLTKELQMSVLDLFPLFDIPVPFYPGLTEKFQFTAAIMLGMAFALLVLSFFADDEHRLIQRFGEEEGKKLSKESDDAQKKAFGIVVLLFLFGWIFAVPYLLWLGCLGLKNLFMKDPTKTSNHSTNT